MLNACNKMADDNDTCDSIAADPTDSIVRQ